MKKLALIFLAMVCFGLTALAQVPDAFKYQAVLRNSDGEIISEQEVSIKISILNESPTGDVAYSEAHAATTNDLGMVSLTIGEGTVVSGNFQLIPWSESDKFLKIEIDESGGSSFSELGTFQLLSVPYALFANSASKLGNNVLYSTSPDTLFVVKDQEGNPVFVVYPDGAEVITNEVNKGKIGGFAVSGRTSTKSEEEYFRITPDSSRIYVNENAAKGKVGGFAVSGRTSTKSMVNDYLFVTADSTRIYVNDSVSDKGKIGGFAVSGRTSTKNETSSWLNITKNNYFIGHESGQNLTTGIYNSALGYESGININSGESNSFVGYQSGYSNQNGSGNLFLGYQTGYSNVDGNYNSFLGYLAGYSNSTGVFNTFQGSFSGYSNTNGSYNTFVGDSSGFSNTSGHNNTFLGTKVGLNNDTGGDNVFIGSNSGYSNENGRENVFIGLKSGYSNKSSGRNVFVGYMSGFNNVNGWDNLYIGTNSGYSNIDGAGNVFLGWNAGRDNQHGVRNIFIGNAAGVSEMGSNLLYITNWGTDSTNSIIWGRMGYVWGNEWHNYKLRFNSRVGIYSEPDPGYTLTIGDLPWQSSAASIKLHGAGDTYNYSTISLSSKGLPIARHWQLSHSMDDHKLKLFYYNGIDQWHDYLVIDTLGTISSNGNMVPLNDNAFSLGTPENKWTAVYATNGTIQTSDIRLKTNIAPLAYGLSKIMMLNPITYRWLNSDTNTQRIGLIAQEVDEVISEVVSKGVEESQTMGINYSELIPVLIKGIQEQQQLIEQQQHEIEELKKLVYKHLKTSDIE